MKSGICVARLSPQSPDSDEDEYEDDVDMFCDDVEDEVEVMFGRDVANSWPLLRRDPDQPASQHDSRREAASEAPVKMDICLEGLWKEIWKKSSSSDVKKPAESPKVVEPESRMLDYLRTNCVTPVILEDFIAPPIELDGTLIEFRSHSNCPQFMAVWYRDAGGVAKFWTSYYLRHNGTYPGIDGGRWPRDNWLKFDTPSGFEKNMRHWFHHLADDCGIVPSGQTAQPFTQRRARQKQSEINSAAWQATGHLTGRAFGRAEATDFATGLAGTKISMSAYRTDRGSKQLALAMTELLKVAISVLKPGTLWIQPDEWCAPLMKRFEGLIIGGVGPDEQMYSYFLSLVPFEVESPTAATIRDKIEKALETVGLKPKDVSMYVSDRAATNAVTAELLGMEEQPCNAHGCQHQVEKIINNRWIARKLRRAHAFNRIARASATFRLTKNVYASEGGQTEEWKTGTRIRWGSHLLMYRALIKNRVVNDICLKDLTFDEIRKLLKGLEKEGLGEFGEGLGTMEDLRALEEKLPKEEEPEGMETLDENAALDSIAARVKARARSEPQRRQIQRFRAEMVDATEFVDKKEQKKAKFRLEEKDYTVMKCVERILAGIDEVSHRISVRIPGTLGMVMAGQRLIDLPVLKMIVPLIRRFGVDTPEEVIEQLGDMSDEDMKALKDPNFCDRVNAEIARAWFVDGKAQFERQYLGKRKSVKTIKQRLYIATMTNPFNTEAVLGAKFEDAIEFLRQAMHEEKKRQESEAAAAAAVTPADGYRFILPTAGAGGAWLRGHSVEGELGRYLVEVFGRGFDGGPIQNVDAAFKFESRPYWTNPERRGRFPLIARVALRHDFYPATSTIVEGLFSTASQFLTKHRRGHMKAATLNRYLMLNFNKSLRRDAVRYLAGLRG
jgi:hypothetical protein